MNEKEFEQKLDKAIREVFNTEEIIDFMFNLTKKALVKGMKLGIEIGHNQREESNGEGEGILPTDR